MSRPKENKVAINSNVASLVTDWVNEEGAPSQVEIAEALDLDRPNIIAMIKTGRTKLPVRHVVPLAKALSKDPEELMNAVLEEYFPDILEAISFSKKKVVNESEATLLNALRGAKKEAQKDLGKKGSLRWKLNPESLEELSSFAKNNLIS